MFFFYRRSLHLISVVLPKAEKAEIRRLAGLEPRKMLSSGGRIEPKGAFFCSCIKVEPLSHSVSAG